MIHIFLEIFIKIVWELFFKSITEKVDLNYMNNLNTIKRNQQRINLFIGTKDYFSNTIQLKTQNNFRIFSYEATHNQIVNQKKEMYLKMIRDFIDNINNPVEKNEVNLSKIDQNYPYTFLHIDIKYTKNHDENVIKIYKNNLQHYIYFLPSSKESKVAKFYNIRLPKKYKEIEITHRLLPEEIEFEFSNTEKYSEKEKERNANVSEVKIDGITIYYRTNGMQEYDKVVFTLPGFSTHYSDDQYLMYDVKSLEEDGLLKISFQDRYFDQGTYMTLDNNYQKVFPALKKFINTFSSVCKPENVYFLGMSKGATIASRFIPEFSYMNFILIVPQLDIEIYKQGREQTNNGLINFWSEGEFPWEKELDCVRYISRNRTNKIILIESLKDYYNNIDFEQHYRFNNLTHLVIDSEHKKVADNTQMYWRDYILSLEIINPTFEMENIELSEEKFSLKLEENIFDSIKEDSDLIFLEFQSFDGRNKQVFKVSSYKNSNVILKEGKKVYKKLWMSGYYSLKLQIFTHNNIYERCITKSSKKVFLNINSGDILFID